MPAIGPNGEKFLDDALPKGEGGHVLAVGEDHTLSAHIDWMREHIGELAKDHNVGIIGIEMYPFLNVFMWAYKDGKLPVEKGKETEYMQSMFRGSLSPDDPISATSKASLFMEAVNQNVEMFGYDARRTLTDAERIEKSSINELQNYPQWTKRLHDTPSLLDNPPNGDPDLQYAYVLMEAEQLLKDNPEYKGRLEAIEKAMEEGRKADIGTDAISVTLLKTSIPEGKNVVTVSGEGHISGSTNQRLSNDGIFHEHLKSEGLTVTPAIITSSDDFKNVWVRLHSPGRSLYKVLLSNCQTRADMNLYVFDTDEILRDLSHLQPSQAKLPNGHDSAAMEIAQSGAVFSCNDPHLPLAQDIYKGDKMNALVNPAVAAAAEQMRHLLLPDGTYAPSPGAPQIERTLRP